MLILYPNDILHKKSELIKIKDKIPHEFLEISEHMKDVISKKNALGLSAIQLGHLYRIIVINTLVYPMTAMYNPSIKSFPDYKVETGYEECLSIPGVVVSVPRFRQIEFSYFDDDAVEHTTLVSGTSSIVIQHELDHLNGKLIIDYRKNHLHEELKHDQNSN